MELKVGQTLFGAQDQTAVIVVRAPKADVVVRCGDREMVSEKPELRETGDDAAAGDGTVVGKRYIGLDGGLELLCIQPGPSPLSVDGQALEIKQARPLPSSD